MKLWIRLAVVAVAASACASGPPKLLGQPIKRPIAVLVRVSDEAAKVDDLGATAALVETLTEGLAERGVKSDVFARDDDNPPTPRIEIWVEKWDPGDEARRAGFRATTLLVPLTSLGQIGAAVRSCGRHLPTRVRRQDRKTESAQGPVASAREAGATKLPLSTWVAPFSAENAANSVPVVVPLTQSVVTVLARSWPLTRA
jgi:hypothetical protein